jgi:acyl carrier protein
MEPYQDVFNTLCGIIEDSVDELTAADISADSDLTGELGIDSLAMFDIADKVQEKWKIKISDDDLTEFTTADSMVTFIRAATADREVPATAEA